MLCYPHVRKLSPSICSIVRNHNSPSTVRSLALRKVSLVLSVVNSIIIGALYLYAAEGTVPQQLDDDLFKRAFEHK